MAHELDKKIPKQNIKVHFELVGAEKLPYQDESFDTVVSTITLCSIPKLSQALEEIRRVLKVGGKFIFLDHGLSDKYSVARWQKILNPVQKIVGNGCQLTIDISAEIEKAGLKIEKLEKFKLDKAPEIIFVYKGIARKPA